jgi:hypothetical protein
VSATHTLFNSSRVAQFTHIVAHQSNQINQKANRKTNALETNAKKKKKVHASVAKPGRGPWLVIDSPEMVSDTSQQSDKEERGLLCLKLELAVISQSHLVGGA